MRDAAAGKMERKLLCSDAMTCTLLKSQKPMPLGPGLNSRDGSKREKKPRLTTNLARSRIVNLVVAAVMVLGGVVQFFNFGVYVFSTIPFPCPSFPYTPAAHANAA